MINSVENKLWVRVGVCVFVVFMFVCVRVFLYLFLCDCVYMCTGQPWLYLQDSVDPQDAWSLNPFASCGLAQVLPHGPYIDKSPTTQKTNKRHLERHTLIIPCCQPLSLGIRPCGIEEKIKKPILNETTET